jgi:PAS domain S-box-containing protein
LRSRLDGALTLYVSRPLLGDDGKLRAVIVAAMNVARLEKLYNYVKLDFDRALSIYLNDGTLIGGLPHRESLIGVRPDDAVVGEFGTLGRTVRFVHRVNRQNVAEDFAIGRVNTYPLIVSVANDERESLASWRETAIPIALGALCMGAIIVVVAVSLTRQLRREYVLGRALVEANDRYMQTVDSMMDAIVAVDERQSIILFNPAAQKMFGLSEEEALGSHLDRLLVHATRERHRGHFRNFTGQEGSARAMGPQYEVQGLRADGSTFLVESAISSTTVGGKKQYTAVLRDVTDRRRAEVDLRELNRQLRGLSASLIDVREQERTRIARELHDDLGQQLTGLKLDLEWVSNRLKGGLKVEQSDIDTMRELLNGAITSVRRISTELRPILLDDLGFAAAIEWQVNEIAKRSLLDISLELNATDHVQNTDRASGLFRILQESLTNVIRHAQATRVEIALLEEGETVRFSIHDNGLGMAQKSHLDSGFGLINMRERAIALGGQLQVISSPGEGTTIEVTFPIQPMPVTKSTA